MDQNKPGVTIKGLLGEMQDAGEPAVRIDGFRSSFVGIKEFCAAGEITEFDYAAAWGFIRSLGASPEDISVLSGEHKVNRFTALSLANYSAGFGYAPAAGQISYPIFPASPIRNVFDAFAASLSGDISPDGLHALMSSAGCLLTYLEWKELGISDLTKEVLDIYKQDISQESSGIAPEESFLPGLPLFLGYLEMAGETHFSPINPIVFRSLFFGLRAKESLEHLLDAVNTLIDDTTATGRRNKALVLTAIDAHLCIVDITRLQLEDLDLKLGEIHSVWSCKSGRPDSSDPHVFLKGSGERVMALQIRDVKRILGRAMEKAGLTMRHHTPSHSAMQACCRPLKGSTSRISSREISSSSPIPRHSRKPRRPISGSNSIETNEEYSCGGLSMNNPTTA